MRNRSVAPVAAFILASALAGCGTPQSTTDTGQGAATTCVACHGGLNDDTGAPPKDTKGRTSTTEVSVGAHGAHVRAGLVAGAFDCTACHRKPVPGSLTEHLDGTAHIVWGGLATAGGGTPAWDRATATCSGVYCHGSTLGGGSNVAPRWTVVDGTQAACGTCHGSPPPSPHPQPPAGSDLRTCSACHPETVRADGTIDVAGGSHLDGRLEAFGGHPADWMTRGSAGFHGLAASVDARSCETCHAVTEPARVTRVVCASCHETTGSGGLGSASCSACHGSAANAAPPRDTQGNTATTFAGVGAHQSHVAATHGMAGALDCIHCHPKPDSVSSAGHADGVVQVTGYTGSDPTLASRLPGQGWDPTAATCTNYCHGSTLQGGTVPSPTWTRVDGTQAACGACHGLPPPNHPELAAGSTSADCGLCHRSTVKPDGSIDAASGAHLNGKVDGFAGHPPGWMDYVSPDFHARHVATTDQPCLDCHAKSPPAHGSAVTCSDCHKGIDAGNWATGCNSCHGSATSDAPPRDLAGNTATTFLGVGAHQSHVQAAHGVAAPLDCTACHPKPTAAFVPPHLDRSVQVTGYTGTDASLLAAVTAPGWDRAQASCATSYCHGATLGGGTASQPVWTRVDGSQAACGACHGLPPPGHPALAPGSTAATCGACHPETVRPDGTIDAARGRHVNGRIDGFTGHPTGWLDVRSASFHGTAAKADLTGCQTCHAVTAPAHASVVTCDRCHDRAAAGDWTLTCSSCHGSAANAAPPRDLSGGTSTAAIGVGAHQSHVTGAHGFAAPLDCTSCHEKPGDGGASHHLDGTVQVTGYTGSDPALAAAVAAPGWSHASATCAASYCHGATPSLGGGAVPVPRWTQTDGSQVFCGSCHGLPPTGHPTLAPGADARTCAVCHPETVRADGTIDVGGGAHVNGLPDGFAGHPAGWATKGSPDFHGTSITRVEDCLRCHTARAPAAVSAVTCASCHDALAGGDWTTSCSGCHGSTANAAPPRDLSGGTATTARGVGAHQPHLTASHGIAAPLDCVHCHAKPVEPFATGHMNGNVEVTGYTGTDPLLLAALPVSSWNGASTTCTNYCHGATLQGGTATSPLWTRVDGTQAACGSCHGLPPPNHPALAAGSTLATCALCHASTVLPSGAIDVASGAHVNGRVDGFTGHDPGWMTASSPRFHGRVTTPGDPSCFTCHAMSPPAYGAAVVCSTCHTAVASGDWKTSCNSCHGSPASPAPPADLLGNTATTFVGVGAHQSHLQGLHGVAAPLDCTSCHPRPTAALQAPHLDGRVDVTGYTGSDAGLLAAVTSPGWDRSTATCTASYCHGATLGGGTSPRPVWTRVDGSQAACGSCHGLPPTRHLALTPPVTAASCAACHPATVAPDGTIDVAGGKHVNGVVEAEGFSGHGVGWLVPGDPAFHGQAAVADGLDSCFACHSAKEPSTNGLPSCASCHDALAGGADWTTSCVGCHGSGTVSAPPKDVHGNTATTAIGVGAHRSHVEATHALSRKFDCDACHVKPAAVFSTGHLDGATTVTGYTGNDPALQFIGDPRWNRTSATCSSTWCHGGYYGAYVYTQQQSGVPTQVIFWYSGKSFSPTWNRVDGTQGACGTCHGVPPSPSGYWHSGLHGGTLNACSLCHPGVKSDGTGFTDASRHVNGTVDVTPSFRSQCLNCH